MRASLASLAAAALVALASVVAAGSAGDDAHPGLDPTRLHGMSSAVATGMSGPPGSTRTEPLAPSFPTPTRDPSRGGASFTCVTDRDRGTCFVRTACELAGATRLGARHVTLLSNITRRTTARTAASSEDDCDAFPIVVRSPMTIVGACEDARCVIDGGARVATAKTRGRPSCDAAGAPALFAVEAGGDLTLKDVDLADACNDVDGAGGAVLVRGGVNAGACGEEGPVARLTMRRARVTRCVAVGVFGDPKTKNQKDQNQNQNHGRGGAVALLDSRSFASFEDCEFEGNEAWGADPAWAAAGAGSVTDYSSSLGNGGCVYVAGGVVAFLKTKFRENVAESEGGAVAVVNGATVAIESCDFEGNRVWDDYWDGGGGVLVGDEGSNVLVSTSRFVSNEVRGYPDPRRRAMTCGGGGASVVRGGVATFRYVMFENNRAPRGGGVCVHDATAVYGGRNDGDDGALSDAPPPVAFRGNAAAHPWIGQTSPAIDVECVQCFERVNGTTGKYAVVVDPSRCAYAADGDAIGSEVCAAPPAGSVIDDFKFDAAAAGVRGGEGGDEGVDPSEPGVGDVAPVAPPERSAGVGVRGMSVDVPPGGRFFPLAATATSSSF